MGVTECMINGGYVRRRILKFSVRFLLVAFVFSGITAALIGIQIRRGNEHVVVAGELYRSAQPTKAEVEQYAREFGIKSILNLRGVNEGSPWYDEEVAAAQDLGIKFINFRMKAARELTSEQANELIEVMRSAPKPLLIHCHAGADRTGLASALYVAAVAKQGEEAAEAQFSLKYGHLPAFPFWWTDAQAMSRTFEMMEPALGFPNS